MLFFYQRFISPFTHSLSALLLGQPHNCRFTPTCSEYTRQAILSYGIIHGSLLGLKRLARCNPLFKGGLDPVPAKNYELITNNQ